MSTTKRTLTQQSNVEKARARRFLMQAVYQYLITQDLPADILENISYHAKTTYYDAVFLEQGLSNILDNHHQLDEQLSLLVSRPISQLDVIDHSILLVAAYELNSEITPPKVVINEAIILAKKFASEESHKFINGVLDKIYHNMA